MAAVCIPLVASSLWAQITPKDKAADYPVSSSLNGGLTIGAEYLLHTLPTKQGSLIANDYLVVEIAIYGAKGKTIDLDTAQFTLRVNKKTTIEPEGPGYVAASLKYSDWENTRRLDLSGGTGNSTVVYGPPQSNRFPGDPTVRPPRTQPLPDDNPAGIEKEPPLSIDERIERAWLPSGEQNLPLAGVVCFPFKGKTKSVKTLELIYKGPAGDVVLKLE